MSIPSPRNGDAPLESGAVISPCGLYRYSLWRRWAAGPHGLWIMLNPSTADATTDDPTIRRCVAFAKLWDCGGIVVVNLYAWRATSPTDLWRTERVDGRDIVGPQNDAAIVAALRDPSAGVRVVAWGAHARPGRAANALDTIRMSDAEIVCLGRTNSGAPRHPLMLRIDTPREPFTPAVRASARR